MIKQATELSQKNFTLLPFRPAKAAVGNADANCLIAEMPALSESFFVTVVDLETTYVL